MHIGFPKLHGILNPSLSDSSRTYAEALPQSFIEFLSNKKTVTILSLLRLLKNVTSTVSNNLERCLKKGPFVFYSLYWILHWGISKANEDYLRRAHSVCPVSAVQNRYSMMARWYESLFPTLEELGIGFVAFSPLANGLLTTNYDASSKFDPKSDYRAAMPQFRKESFEQNQHLFDYLLRLADEHHATPSQISLAWMLCKKPWIVPIPGTRHLCRLKENAGAADIKLTPEEVDTIYNTLDKIQMSEVFGGSKMLVNNK